MNINLPDPQWLGATLILGIILLIPRDTRMLGVALVAFSLGFLFGKGYTIWQFFNQIGVR